MNINSQKRLKIKFSDISMPSLTNYSFFDRLEPKSFSFYVTETHFNCKSLENMGNSFNKN